MTRIFFIEIKIIGRNHEIISVKTDHDLTAYSRNYFYDEVLDLTKSGL